jgi:DNA-binding transcriptional LysR family regulator
MNLQHLAAFRAIMLTGKISGAAEVLGRSQPAVSRILDKLEFELGLTLFERRKGQVTPTPEAHLLLDEVERAYVTLDSLRAFASRLVKGEGGRVSIAVMPALGINFLPSVLCRFRKDWSETKVTLNVRMSLTIEEWAATQQIDFGLAETPLRRSGFSTESFSDAPYIVAVPRGHPLEDRSVIEPKDLQQAPLIYWTSFLPARHRIDQVLNAAGIKVEAAYETTYSAAAYEMVKNGMGISVIDPFTAVLQQDDRAVLRPFAPKVSFNVGLLRPKSRPASRATEALLELMFEERDAVLSRLPT